MYRVAKILFLGLVGLVVGAGLLVASAIAHAQLAVGRAAIRDLVEDMVDDRMQGSFAIGALTTMWPGPITAVNVVARDPGGKLVFRVAETRMWIEPLALLDGGDLRMHQVRVDGAEIRLEETPSGELTLERAFDRPPGVRDRRVVSMQDVHLEGVRVVLDVHDVPRIVFEDASAFADFLRSPDQSVELRIDRAKAVVARPDLPGVDVAIARLWGTHRSKAAKSVDLRMIGYVDDGRFLARLQYFPHEDPGAYLAFRPAERDPGNFLAAIGLRVLAASADIDLKVDRGPRGG